MGTAPEAWAEPRFCPASDSSSSERLVAPDAISPESSTSVGDGGGGGPLTAPLRAHPRGRRDPPVQVGAQLSSGAEGESDPGGGGDTEKAGRRRGQAGDGGNEGSVEMGGHGGTRATTRGTGKGGGDGRGDTEGHGGTGAMKGPGRGWGTRRGSGGGLRPCRAPRTNPPRPGEDPDPPPTLQGSRWRLRCRRRGLTIPGSGGSGRSATASARPPPWTAPLPGTHRKLSGRRHPAR